MKYFSSDFKLGIIAGGQLGKMLCSICNNWDIQTFVMDSQTDAPASTTCHEFYQGDFSKYEDVYNFGKKVDVLTLELEHVNIQALLDLKKEGLIIHPDPEKLKIIQDKALQKRFFLDHSLPTGSFLTYNSKKDVLNALENKEINLPFVQKSRTLGYDGKGVVVVKETKDIDTMLDIPCIIESLISIEKEIAVLVAKNEMGEISCFDPVEMVFNPEGNLVDLLICPAEISEHILEKAKQIALDTIKSFNISGLLAVEMFLDKNGEIWINEVAPRPHNSGHHTIESTQTSQFEQHIRAVLNLPLGETHIISPSVMLNLIGEKGYYGPVIYKNMEKVLAISGAKFHLYGKKQTKPLRKMGHVTILDSDINRAIEKAQQIKNTLKIISQN